jgi:response regulator RpfG family c-di-GMP phosphodiesterase
MSRPRILLVDDEPNVVGALRAMLRKRYTISTAESGHEALALIEREDPFVAIVSDMRMPTMDGADLLMRVRRSSPSTVRLLLTGHAEIDAAMAAVNQGQVFRFLLKPCPPDELIASLDAAVEQHRLVTGERVLLEETLSGAVQALIDGLSLASPKAFGRASRLRDRACELAREVGMDDVWELELAATLSQIGCVTLPAATAERYASGQPLVDSDLILVERLPATAARILHHIPRLENVHAMLRAQNFAANDRRVCIDGVPLGARILRIAHDFDVLESQGLPLEVAVETLRGRKDAYDAELLESFAMLRGVAARTVAIREVRLREVKPGMVFVDDVCGRTGTLLVPRGYTVTVSLLEKIHNLPVEIQNDTIRVSRALMSGEPADEQAAAAA